MILQFVDALLALNLPHSANTYVRLAGNRWINAVIEYCYKSFVMLPLHLCYLLDFQRIFNIYQSCKKEAD